MPDLDDLQEPIDALMGGRVAEGNRNGPMKYDLTNWLHLVAVLKNTRGCQLLYVLLKYQGQGEATQYNVIFSPSLHGSVA